jgi:hypothetical protein
VGTELAAVEYAVDVETMQVSQSRSRVMREGALRFRFQELLSAVGLIFEECC